MNQEKIKKLEKTIKSGYSNIAGMIVQKNGHPEQAIFAKRRISDVKIQMLQAKRRPSP